MSFFGANGSDFDKDPPKEGKDAEFLGNGRYRLVIDRHCLLEKMEHHKKYPGAPGFVLEATVKEVLAEQVYVKDARTGANTAHPSIHAKGTKVKVIWPLPTGPNGAIYRDKVRAHIAPLLSVAPSAVTNEVLNKCLAPDEATQKAALAAGHKVGPEAFAGREIDVSVKPGISSKGTQYTNFYWSNPPE